MNNHVFVPSHGIGEMYLNVSDMFWYYYESTIFNIDKEIPFMQLLLDMPSYEILHASKWKCSWHATSNIRYWTFIC